LWLNIVGLEIYTTIYSSTETFINQIDLQTLKIDYSISVDILERSFSMSSNYR